MARQLQLNFDEENERGTSNSALGFDLRLEKQGADYLIRLP